MKSKSTKMKANITKTIKKNTIKNSQLSKVKANSLTKTKTKKLTAKSIKNLSENARHLIAENLAVEITDLQKTYYSKDGASVQALKKVSLHIQHGDFFALLGVNGAGKTTMLGIMSGLVNKSSGEVKIYGFDTEFQSSLSKMQIGLVPQEFNFNIFEKTLDIVVSQAGFYGIARNEATIRATKILSELGLGDKLQTISQNLSGGMKRRLMIARALVHRPRLLILDEPTAGVDVELRRGMWDYLNKLNQQGTTILLTTHYLEEAEQLCRNVAIIDKGLIVQQGSVKNLLAKVDKQTFKLEIDELTDPQMDNLFALKLNSKLPLTKIERDTLQIEIFGRHSLGQVLSILIENEVQINSIQPRENRLEELFLGLVNKS